jgi:hypothetical protein
MITVLVSIGQEMVQSQGEPMACCAIGHQRSQAR